MSYKVGSVVSVVCVVIGPDADIAASQNPNQFVAFYKKVCKQDCEQISYEVAKVGITEASDFGFEGEVIGGSVCETGELASCSKKGYWVIDGREYIELEHFKTLFKSVLTIGLIKYINGLLRQYNKPATFED